MKDGKNIPQEIEATLNSLEGIRRAEPSYFFESKLISKLESRSRSGNTSAIQLLIRPAFAVGVLTAFIVLNIFTITAVLQHSKQQENVGLQNLAQEYNLNTNSLYDTHTTQ